MWKLESAKTVKATKSLATEFSTMDAAPHDRPLSERRLAIYGKMLERGEFRPCNWAKAFCGETDQWYRVNGKHTSIMLSGLNELPEFFINLESYKCDTLEDVAKLYSTYDSKIASRTSADVNRIFAGSVPALSEVPLRVVTATISGMSYAEHGQMYGKIPAAERAEAILDNVDFCLWVHEMIGDGSKYQHLRRVPVVAAMFVCWTKSHKAATDFWTAVRDETGKSPTLPDRRLAKFLVTIAVNTGQGAFHARKAQPREFFVKCIHGWNAWRKNETTDLKYYAAKKIPAVV